VMNRMTKKVKEELLLPTCKLNKAAREAILKHNPPMEFRDSIYRCRDEHAPTLVHFPENAFKKAMAQAAIDTPGATKAAIGRLVQVIDPTVHIFGIPYLYMAVVRQAGMQKAPDIRTRALFPLWGCLLTIQYIRDLIREQDIANLLANAGMIVGIGDGRTEKGTFNYGQWELVHEDDKRLRDLMSKGGRKAQLAAMETPQCYDEDSQELLNFFHTEIVRREADHKVKVKAPHIGVMRDRRGRRATADGKHARVS